MGRTVSYHDDDIPLHRDHSNQVGIVGTSVVQNAQTFGNFLHVFCNLILIIHPYSPPSTLVGQVLS